MSHKGNNLANATLDKLGNLSSYFFAFHDWILVHTKIQQRGIRDKLDFVLYCMSWGKTVAFSKKLRILTYELL